MKTVACIVILLTTSISFGSSHAKRDLRSGMISAERYNCSSVFFKGPHLGILPDGFFLKMDQVPDIYKPGPQAMEKPAPFIWGVPNFRVTSDAEIFGTGHPSKAGVEQMVHEIRKTTSQDTQVIWMTFREEPVFFIRGESFNMRLDLPKKGNIAITGIDLPTLAETEKLLKAEIIHHLEKNNFKLPVVRENAQTQLWVEEITVRPSEVQTLSEFIAENNAKEKNFKILRIPVTDRSTPELRDIDTMIEGFRSCASQTTFLTSCHAGIGRTTTAISGLIYLKSTPRVFTAAELQNLAYPAGMKNSLQKIESLLGKPARAWAEEVMAANTTLINLLDDAPYFFREKLTLPENPGLYVEAVRRYLTLVALAQYSIEQKAKGFATPFSAWVKAKPELEQLLKNPVLD